MANDIDKTSPHYKGDFGSIYEVNKKFPTGGVAGDFVVIEGWAHYWNADRATWCVNAQRDSYWDELITNIIEKFKLVRGATYMGVASLDTAPAKVIGAKMYYFATVAGTYKNFGNLVVPQGINVLYSENGSSWVNTTLLEVAQELGVSTKKVVSQKALNDALNLKANQSSVNEALAKKANTADVDTKFTEEKKRVDVELAKKFDKESVVQESGEAEDKVMSQKAVSDKLSGLSDRTEEMIGRTSLAGVNEWSRTGYYGKFISNKNWTSPFYKIENNVDTVNVTFSSERIDSILIHKYDNFFEHTGYVAASSTDVNSGDTYIKVELVCKAKEDDINSLLSDLKLNVVGASPIDGLIYRDIINIINNNYFAVQSMIGNNMNGNINYWCNVGYGGVKTKNVVVSPFYKITDRQNIQVTHDKTSYQIQTFGVDLSFLAICNNVSDIPSDAYFVKFLFNIGSTYSDISKSISLINLQVESGLELCDYNKPITRYLNRKIFNRELRTQGGRHYFNNGYLCEGSLASDFLSGFGTINLIKFNPKYDELLSIGEIESGEDFIIFCYDKECNYIGYIKNSLTNIPIKTEYIGIDIQRTDNYKEIRNIKISLISSREFELSKRFAPRNELVYFGFEVRLNNNREEPDDINVYNGVNERHFDNGYIYLPSNYTNDGEPVPLILFVHGTGQHPWATKVPPSGEYSMYDSLFKFLTYNGYAVASCCGVTDKNHKNYGVKDFKCAPIGLDCYNSMYKFLIENYNISTDGCYVFGKSTGGQGAMQIAFNGSMKIKAVGQMTPSMSSLGSDLRYCENPTLNFVMTNLGINDANFTPAYSQGYNFSEKEQQIIIDNIDRFIGYDPFSICNTVDYTALTKALFKYKFREVDKEDVWQIVNTGKIIQNFPLKIWDSEDDNATPFIYERFYQKMARNGGSICYLRKMPKNTGGRDNHFCVDSSSAITTNYNTKYNGTVKTTVAFAELVDWFNHWR